MFSELLRGGLGAGGRNRSTGDGTRLQERELHVEQHLKLTSSARLPFLKMAAKALIIESST